MPSRHAWLYAGLALTTFATLLVEILNTRFLSVITWYHLSFLAISIAMLGMAAGAVYVFLRSSDFEEPRTADRLSGSAMGMALAIAASHLVGLCIPIPTLSKLSVMEILPIAVAVCVLTVPFVLSGIVVTTALTRTGAPIGRLYSYDLAGAAVGCLCVIPLLTRLGLSAAVFVAAASSAAAAFCFARVAGRTGRSMLVLAVGLFAVAGLNGATSKGLGLLYPKNRTNWFGLDSAVFTAWNSHSYVVLSPPGPDSPFYWSAGKGADRSATTLAWLTIDGEAGTPVTQWNGAPDTLDWTQYDLTALPYHLRQRGDVGVIGVGGGKDILAALWARSRSITGIEINAALLDVLQRQQRDFARIADRQEVNLVHDEARSFLTRTPLHFDVLQMSLVDTWAATGAGAFTLSENGLYTVDGWQVFLRTLAPGGIFSVSRWYSPSAVSETNRLLALGVAALIRSGVREPAQNVVLASRGGLATMMVSRDAFTNADRETLKAVADRMGFTLLVAPGVTAATARLARIAASTSEAGLDVAVSDPDFDYRPPTDNRPFFFNMLKPASFMHLSNVPRGGAIGGNVRATSTLVLLFLIAAVLVVAIVVWPLWRSGLPEMRPGVFALSASYFALIGAGFMLIQIPLLQRLSVFLGHPTYTLAVVLLSMILFTAFGSVLSDRVPIEGRLVPIIPLGIAAGVVLMVLVMGPVMARTIHLGLAARSATAVALIAPVATLLGFCFPIGMRLVGRVSDHATAWMWGINGAFGVLASIVAVGVSMWLGIPANLVLAAALYATLGLVTRGLARRTTAS